MMMAALLLAAGLAGLVGGFVFFLKRKRLAAEPFCKTGEIAANPGLGDLRGIVSTEGRVVAVTGNVLRAPCSGQACLYYEVRVEREWETTAADTQGTKKRTGSTNVTTQQIGTLFQLNDGSGPLRIDAREGVDADLNTTHDERILVGSPEPKEVQFGQMKVQVPVYAGPERTTAFHATEAILPAQGVLYARGKVIGSVLARPGWTPLILSRRGRNARMGLVRAKATAGLVLGAALTFASIPAFLFARARDGGEASPCVKGGPAKCDESVDAGGAEEGAAAQWAPLPSGAPEAAMALPSAPLPHGSAKPAVGSRPGMTPAKGGKKK